MPLEKVEAEAGQIHALVDALGYPIEILLTGANVHDSVPAADFIQGKQSKYFIGDRAYDSNAIRAAVSLFGLSFRSACF